MNTQRLRKLRSQFCNEFTPPHTQRAYIRAWVRCVRRLGLKWLGAPRSVTRLAEPLK